MLTGFLPPQNDQINSLEEDEGALSPFEIDWGIQLPKQETSRLKDEGWQPRVDSDDYTPEEAAIFRIVKANVRLACNVNTSWRKRKKALEWCFVRGTPDENGLEFHLACTALGARPHVVQARMHHQFYVAGIPMKEPMSVWADPLPDQYESEAIMAAWEPGLALVSEVWRWPGIPLAILANKTGEQEIDQVMDKLEKAGLVRVRFGFVFLTGRAPERVKRRNFSWSKSFF